MKINANSNKTTYTVKSPLNYVDAELDKEKNITKLVLCIDGKKKEFKGDLVAAWKKITNIIMKEKAGRKVIVTTSKQKRK